jgi:prepilin-type N-terminal cleavage/methylation domain-containing protein/prepilin-type processing-associated H-X9-DG protein
MPTATLGRFADDGTPQAQGNQQMSAPARPRAGFTLVELLVVIAIIGVLVGLLLPAVQAARESARRSSCGNNFKQIGLGINVYTEARKQLPPGGVTDRIGGGWGSGWTVFILPFIEQAELFDKLTFVGGSGWGAPSGTNNQSAAQNVLIRTYRCPSSTTPMWTTATSSGARIMNNNYVGISGAINGLIPGYTETRIANPGGSVGCCSGGIASGGGALFPAGAIGTESFRDGTSSTMAVAEQNESLTVLVGGVPTDVYWNSGSQHGWQIGSPVGAPPPSNSGGDNRTFQQTTIRYQINQRDWTGLITDSTGNCNLYGICNNISTNAPLTSGHNGVNTAFVDGSVRFLADTTDLAILARLATRDDRQPTPSF